MLRRGDKVVGVPRKSAYEQFEGVVVFVWSQQPLLGNAFGMAA